MSLLPIIAKPFFDERDRWFLWAPLGIGVGVVIYFQMPFEPGLGWLVLTPALVLAVWLVRERFGLRLFLMLPLLMAAGFNAGQIETRLLYAPMLDRRIGPTTLTGRLVFTEVMPKGVRLTIREPEIDRLMPDKEPLKIRIRLGNKTLDDVPPTGTLVNMWGEIGPFSEPVVPGATDFRWQGYFKQLGGLGWSTSDIDLVDAHPPPLGFRDEFNLLFEHARQVLTAHVYRYLDGDVAAMTAARLHGEQTGITEPVIQAMRTAGLAHLLSTSGFHVTIMGLLVYFPLRAIFALIPWIALRYPIKKWAAFGAILSTIGYTLLVGAPAATLRSMIMVGLAMIAVIIDRPSMAMRLVMLSAAIVMVIAPDATLGPSFQMSFAAVMCLIAAHERIPGPYEPKKKPRIILPPWIEPVWRHLYIIIRTSLIATAATTPFTIYHFSTFSFYGFAANALAIPITGFWIMPCLLMAYITVPLNLDGPFLIAAGWGIELTIQIALTVASWPYALLYAPAMPPEALALFIVGGLWLCLWRLRWRWLGLLPVLIGALYPLYTAKPDVMISPDGKVWGVVLSDGRLAMSRLKRDNFIAEQFQETLGHPDLVDAGALSDNPELRCDNSGCVYRHAKHVVAFPRIESAALEDCESADIIVASYVIKQCDAKIILDDPDFWHHGSHAIYFEGDKVRVEYAREKRGMRPWSPGWGYEPPAKRKYQKRNADPAKTQTYRTLEQEQSDELNN